MSAEHDEPMTLAEDAVAFFQGPLPEAKAMRDACLEADIPAILDRGACCGSGGCGCAPKLQVLVSRDDLPRAARLIADRWRASVLQEGTIDDTHPLAMGGAEHEVEPCPACGSKAELVAGACVDCGLQLE